MYNYNKNILYKGGFLQLGPEHSFVKNILIMLIIYIIKTKTRDEYWKRNKEHL